MNKLKELALAATYEQALPGGMSMVTTLKWKHAANPTAVLGLIARVEVLECALKDADIERDALHAQVAELSKDAERYRWLFGARTKEKIQKAADKPPELLPQDTVIGLLSSWYFCKEDADAAIDAQEER